jgi:hypothetical protein
MPSQTKRNEPELRPTRRWSEWEPADSLKDKSNVTGGWLPPLNFSGRKPSEIATMSKMQMREHSSAGRVKIEPESVLHLPCRLGISASSDGLWPPIMDVYGLWREVPPSNGRVVHCAAHFGFSGALNHHRGLSVNKMIPNRIAAKISILSA